MECQLWIRSGAVVNVGLGRKAVTSGGWPASGPKAEGLFMARECSFGHPDLRSLSIVARWASARIAPEADILRG
jgi:hypothetical protein